MNQRSSYVLLVLLVISNASSYADILASIQADMDAVVPVCVEHTNSSLQACASAIQNQAGAVSGTSAAIAPNPNQGAYVGASGLAGVADMASLANTQAHLTCTDAQLACYTVCGETAVGINELADKALSIAETTTDQQRKARATAATKILLKARDDVNIQIERCNTLKLGQEMTAAGAIDAGRTSLGASETANAAIGSGASGKGKAALTMGAMGVGFLALSKLNKDGDSKKSKAKTTGEKSETNNPIAVAVANLDVCIDTRAHITDENCQKEFLAQCSENPTSHAGCQQFSNDYCASSEGVGSSFCGLSQVRNFCADSTKSGCYSCKRLAANQTSGSCTDPLACSLSSGITEAEVRENMANGSCSSDPVYSTSEYMTLYAQMTQNSNTSSGGVSNVYSVQKQKRSSASTKSLSDFTKGMPTY